MAVAEVDREAALAALNQWVDAWGGKVIPSAGDHSDGGLGFEREFDEELVAAVAEAIAATRVTWSSTDELPPDDDEPILARTDDGRVLICRPSILRSMMKTTTPDHLRFPATRWTRVPA